METEEESLDLARSTPLMAAPRGPDPQTQLVVDFLVPRINHIWEIFVKGVAKL